MAGRNARRSMADYSVATHAQGKQAADGRMERYHEYVGRRRVERRVWPGAAFIVEALLLLVFLAGSLAVLMSLNADADRTGRESADLMGALVLASNAAEEFAADPVGFQEAYEADSMADRWLSQPLDEVESGSDILTVECAFRTEDTEVGTLHHVVLEVWKVRALTDPAQADAAGIGLPPGGAAFQGFEEEPVYTLSTSRYVPADRGGAAGATTAIEGVVSHG